jgi:hypothetical protein
VTKVLVDVMMPWRILVCVKLLRMTLSNSDLSGVDIGEHYENPLGPNRRYTPGNLSRRRLDGEVLETGPRIAIQRRVSRSLVV